MTDMATVMTMTKWQARTDDGSKYSSTTLNVQAIRLLLAHSAEWSSGNGMVVLQCHQHWKQLSIAVLQVSTAVVSATVTAWQVVTVTSTTTKTCVRGTTRHGKIKKTQKQQSSREMVSRSGTGSSTVSSRGGSNCNRNVKDSLKSPINWMWWWHDSKHQCRWWQLLLLHTGNSTMVN